jgi:hypothetical protein
MNERVPLLSTLMVPFCSVRALRQPVLAFASGLFVGGAAGVGAAVGGRGVAVVPPPVTVMPLILGL